MGARKLPPLWERSPFPLSPQGWWSPPHGALKPLQTPGGLADTAADGRQLLYSSKGAKCRLFLHNLTRCLLSRKCIDDCLKSSWATAPAQCAGQNSPWNGAALTGHIAKTRADIEKRSEGTVCLPQNAENEAKKYSIFWSENWVFFWIFDAPCLDNWGRYRNTDNNTCTKTPELLVYKFQYFNDLCKILKVKVKVAWHFVTLRDRSQNSSCDGATLTGLISKVRADIDKRTMTK